MKPRPIGRMRPGRQSDADRQRKLNATFRALDMPSFQTEVREVAAKRAPSTANGLLEADVLADSLAALRSHKDVAFAWRLQSGVFIDGNRTVRVGFKGMPDIVGMLRNGRLFVCEVKRELGGSVTPEQRETLDRVRQFGGLAGVARSAIEALEIINGA